MDTNKKSVFMAPDLSEPHISDDMRRQMVDEASNAAQNRAANVWWLPLRLLAFLPHGGSRPLSSLRRSSLVALACCFFHLKTPTCTLRVLRYCEVTQTQCSRPHGTATCVLQTAIWLGTCQSTLTQVERSSEPVLVCHRVSRDTCVHIPAGGPRCVSWNTRGLLGSAASAQRSREQKHIYLTRLARKKRYLLSRVTYSIPNVWYLHTKQRECWRVGCSCP